MAHSYDFANATEEIVGEPLDLEPWVTTSLCALNPLTGTEEVLYSCPGWRLDRQLAEDALWFEDEEGRILCRPLGETEDTVVTRLPQAVQIMGIYTEDILLYGQEDGQTWLYIYNRGDGTQYLIDSYARYAIASRESLLDKSVPMTPVTRPGTPGN